MRQRSQVSHTSSFRFFRAIAIVLAAVFCLSLLGMIPQARAESEDSLTFVGSPYMRNILMKSIIEKYKGENPDTTVNMHLGGGWNDWWPGATRGVASGKADIMLTSRLDWKWRAREDDREKLQYVAIAQEPVYRSGEEVGSVEYGFVTKDEPTAQAEKFIEFVRSQAVQGMLDEMDRFATLDTTIEQASLPEYWREKPWESPEKPMMVHGIDVHYNQFRTATIAELQKIKMQGYNSVMLGGQTDPINQWAEENGLMLSGWPRISEEEQKNSSRLAAGARKTHKYNCLRGVYLANEDRISKRMKWLVTLSEGGTPRHGNEERWAKWRKILKRFPDYLREKHGSLEVLNERWGSSYDKWSEIDFPDLDLDELKEIAPVQNKEFLTSLRLGMPHRYYYMANNPSLLDAYRYVRQEWAKRYEKMVEEIKPNCREGFLYCTKTGGDPYAQRAVKSFNAASWDHTICKFPPQEVQTLVDTVQTALGRPLWNSEAHLYNSKHDYRATPERVRYVLLRNYLCGELQNSSYDRLGHVSKSVREIDDLAIATRNLIRKNESVFRRFTVARSEAALTILATEANRAWNTLPNTPDRPELGGTIKGYAYASALGKHWKYVLNRDVSPEHVKKTLVVDAPWLMEETLQRIVDLPESREVIVVGDVPVTNEYKESLPQDLVQKFKDRITTIDSWEDLDQVVSPARDLPEEYQQVIQAKFWYWNPWMGQYQYTIPVPALEARRVWTKDNLYVAVINHSEQGPISAPIPWTDGHEVRVLTDPDNQDPIEQSNYSFPPESVVIFEISQ